MRGIWIAAGSAVLLVTACTGPGGDVGHLGSGNDVNGASANSGGPARPEGQSAPLPEARTEVAGTAWRDGMAVLGGLTAAGTASAKVHLYDPKDDKWTDAPALPTPLHHTAAVVGPDGRLWVLGGYVTRGEAWSPSSDVWSLGPGDERWRAEPELEVARGALAATVAGETIVAVGGETEGRGSVDSVSRVVEFLEPGGDQWQRGPDLNEPREHLAAATTGDRVIVMGGRVGSLDSNLRSVESWSPGEGTWRRELPLQKERGGFAASTVNGVPCVAGGEQPERTISLIECLRDGEWRVVGQLSEPRHGLATASLGGRLHVVGGGRNPGLFVSATHEVIDVGR